MTSWIETLRCSASAVSDGNVLAVVLLVFSFSWKSCCEWSHPTTNDGTLGGHALNGRPEKVLVQVLVLVLVVLVVLVAVVLVLVVVVVCRAGVRDEVEVEVRTSVIGSAMVA